MQGQLAKQSVIAETHCAYCSQHLGAHKRTADNMLVCVVHKEVIRNPNPVYYDLPLRKWKFYNEVWEDSGEGPFDTYAEAFEGLKKYAQAIIDEDEED